jgi:uncharacterized NAD(P)/FAD-binding protein YdhS
MPEFDVAVIGAGASGALLGVQLHRQSPSLRVAVIEAGARAARGLAYGTPYGAHLLNVPAARMSAFADKPAHFLEWLTARQPEADGSTFAPRSLYGEYLGEALGAACTEGSTISRAFGTAVGLLPSGSGWNVHLHDGRRLEAGAVVLALGNLPPNDPRLVSGNPEWYFADPWAPAASQGVAADAPVLIIGTGLTMIDLVLALRSEGHRGVIHAVSRRGLLPQTHCSHSPRGLSSMPPVDDSPRAALRWIRSEVAAALGEGSDWRAVIDSLRPHTQAMWTSLSAAGRGSFLRHARAHWDVHRHRCAPEVGAAVEGLLREGRLVTYAGRVRPIPGDEPEAEIIRRSDGGVVRLRAERVINCSGPATDYASVDLPLVVQLRRAGWLVPDPHRLGIECDSEGRVTDLERTVVPGLYTIGPLRRAQLWESTAIPEIRQQAVELAALLAKERR